MIMSESRAGDPLAPQWAAAPAILASADEPAPANTDGEPQPPYKEQKTTTGTLPSQHHYQAAHAAPSRHPRPGIGGYMSAADLARLDNYTGTAGGELGAGSADSAPSSLGVSRAGSECGDMPPTPPPGALAAAAAARALSRLGAAPPSRPDSATSFSSGPCALPPTSGDVVAFNWSKQSHRPTAEAALDTLVAAMADDPVNAFLLGGSPSARFARKEIKGYLKALPEATHFIATRDAAAVALWQLLPQETPANELLAGWTRILRVPLRLWPALVALELRYEAAHARQAAEEPGVSYYYLSFIGTAPAARGRGYASSLIRFITTQADATRRSCLLEATSERSRSLYERHGFVTYDTYRVTSHAPPVFFMRREPQPFAGGLPPRAGTPLPNLPPPRAEIGCFGGRGRPKGVVARSKGALLATGGAASEADTDDEGGLISTAVVSAGHLDGHLPVEGTESSGSGSNGTCAPGADKLANSKLSGVGLASADGSSVIGASSLDGMAVATVKTPAPRDACES